MNRKRKRISRLIICVALIVAFCGTAAAAYGSLTATLSNEARFTQDALLGSFAADAVRTVARTEIALVPAGELGLNLQGGEVTKEAINLSFRNGGNYAIFSLTEAELWEVLEISVSRVTYNSEFAIDDAASAFDGFLQISGFQFRYDVSAPVGERVLEVKLDNGVSLARDGTALLQAAGADCMVTGDYGYPVREVEKQLPNLPAIIEEYAASAQLFSQPESGRIRHIGTTDNRLIDKFPAWIIVVVILAVTILRYPSYSKMRRSEYMPRYKDDQL